MLSFKKLINATIAIAMFASHGLADVVQFKITEEMRIQRKGIMVPEFTIPVGAVLELDTTKAPVKRQVFNGKKEISLELYQGVRLVSAPGMKEDDIDRANSLAGDRGFSVSTDAKVVPVARKKGQVRTTRPTTIYNEALQDPNEAEAQKKGVNSGEADGVVETIRQGQNAAKRTGTQPTTCPGCMNDDFGKWINKWLAEVPAKSRNDMERALHKAHEMWLKNPGGRIKNKRYVAVNNFRQHSGEKRMYILDTQTGQMIRYYTGHGGGTNGSNCTGRRGSNNAKNGRNFSSEPSSCLTPEGFHVTEDRIVSTWLGSTLKIHGIEARTRTTFDRGIWIHQSASAADRFVESYGYTGMSQGCLTIDPNKVVALQRRLVGGALIYNYVND